ncbi:hypothetical protein AGMMS49950_09300 [Endomicrobiia bacterium]|nr:hypothetical protein AGMMS49531_10360 [Endomicrobiia bacterium]GHT67966.1 hypothetical protein AGMMS49556_09720 [Endomicrobiia bacterium]GHT71864.1 hypothetical protein AGMMS49950_09300 [Endomicrobiia bacterium]
MSAKVVRIGHIEYSNILSLETVIMSAKVKVVHIGLKACRRSINE